MARPRAFADEDVFAAVGAVLAESGPTGLTVAAVAERLGVTGPAVTQRFGSRRDLLVAWARREADEAASAFVVDPEACPLAALVDGLVALAGPVADRRAFAHGLAVLQLDVADPELRRLAARHSRAVRDAIETLASRAVDAGELLASVEPGRLADLLHAVQQGALVTWGLAGRGRLDRWVRERVETALGPYRA